MPVSVLGMQWSPLIVQGGEVFTTLSAGVPCPGDDAAVPAGPGATKVLLKNFAFNPTPVSIKVGDTIHWIWQEDDHLVTADAGDFDSGVLNNSSTFDYMFMTAGTFRCFCKIHGGPAGSGMSGRVAWRREAERQITFQRYGGRATGWGNLIIN